MTRISVFGALNTWALLKAFIRLEHLDEGKNGSGTERAQNRGIGWLLPPEAPKRIPKA
jgi:hypothetical protein